MGCNILLYVIHITVTCKRSILLLDPPIDSDKKLVIFAWDYHSVNSMLIELTIRLAAVMT